MSPAERFAAFLGGKPMDRFLCVPLILNHAARVRGVKVGQYNRNGRLMGECHAAAYRRYGHDMIAIFSDTAIIAEAMGTEPYCPEDDVPRVERPALADPKDRSRLVSSDWADRGRLPVFYEAVRTACEALHGEAPIGCCVPAPFTTAACLRGTDQLARDLYRNRALAQELIALSLEAAKQFAGRIVDSGGVPVLVDPVATGSVLGRRQFEEFALPYLKPLHAHIAARGRPALLHICGQTARILDPMAQSGAALLSLDDIPTAEARDRVGGRVALMGNVRPAGTLLKGRPEDVLREVRELCDIGRKCPAGFILASGCEVPIASPAENIDAMMSGVREYGAMT
jgi:uroporphyrinogen decarboxylase